MRYANAAARDASIPVPVSGDVAWLLDVDRVTIYTGAAWVALVDDTVADATYLQVDGSNPMAGVLNMADNAVTNVDGVVTVFQDATTRIFGTLAGGVATVSIKVVVPVTGSLGPVSVPYRPSVGSIYWVSPTFTSTFATKPDEYATFKMDTAGVIDVLAISASTVNTDILLCNVSYAVGVRGQ